MAKGTSAHQFHTLRRGGASLQLEALDLKFLTNWMNLRLTRSCCQGRRLGLEPPEMPIQLLKAPQKFQVLYSKDLAPRFYIELGHVGVTLKGHQGSGCHIQGPSRIAEGRGSA